MLMRLTVSFFGAAWVSLAPALACSIVMTPHELDPREQRLDRRPPERVEAAVARITRGRGPFFHENGTVTGSSCDDLGVVALRLKSVPKDDRTPSGKLGYRVIHVDGELPASFILSDKPRRDLTPDRLLIEYWIDGATDEQEPVEFALAVIAVDLAGNESAPSEPIWVRNPGRRGDASDAESGAP